MPRRVQDIVPAERRSIREIEVERDTRKKTSSRGSKSVPKADKETPVRIHKIDTETDAPREEESVTPSISIRSPRKKVSPSSKEKKPWLLIVLVIIVIVAGCAFMASSYFSHATFTIVPKTIPVAVNGTFVAQNTQASTDGALAYELITVNQSASTTVPAINGTKISTKAQGTVTILNTFSAQAQRLVAGTRLSDAQGRIYRLTASVSVPGYTKVGGTLKPGSLTASIVADQPGEAYNMYRTGAVSDFKFVGFAGTAKYETIYARPISDIAGGFVGTKKIVSPTMLASTSAALQQTLRPLLEARARAALSGSSVLYGSLLIPSYSTPTIGGAASSSATVAVQGTMTVVLLKKNSLLSRLVGDSKLSTFSGFSYETPGLEALDVSIVNSKDFSPQKKNTLIVRMKGDFSVIPVIPTDEISKKLAGTALTDAKDTLKAYNPIISSVTGVMVPPWAKVPSDISRISVEVQPTK